MDFGSQSMVTPLRRVIVKRPQEAFGTDAQIHAQWQDLGYLAPPDFERACQEHEAFVNILLGSGAEVLLLDDNRVGLDSIYTHDAGIVTNEGAIIFQTGKPQRRGEGPALADWLRHWDVPLLGVIDGNATAEGGDMVWLNEKTLLVGRGFRTNRAGVEALTNMLSPYSIRVIEFHLPYATGARDVLHLMSLISLLDHDLAAVYLPLMPVPLYQLLQENGIEMIEVPEAEYLTLGCNILALAPRHALMAAGNPVTQEKLEKTGCKVQTFEAAEIGVKGSGGPTCLTRPLLRQI